MKLFYDKWGYLRGWCVSALIIIGLALIFIFVNMYSSWACDNYNKITGRDSVYVNFDSCYVKNLDGDFIRYDSNYKE